MIYLDLKYLHSVQFRLEGFERKKDRLFVCRCPICGDSRTNKNKKRFYVYAWKDELKVRCHNCDYSRSFRHFLKEFDHTLYDEYRLEYFREKFGTQQPRAQSLPEPPKQNTAEKLEARKTMESIFHSICTSLDNLPADNPAVKYCIERKIPKFQLSRLYYIDDTMKLKQLNPDLDIKFSEQRLVIPFFDKNGLLLGLTCRALKKTNLRYLTVKLTDEVQIFGMDKVDPTKHIYIVEGPIDSLFLPNSIAVTGTAFGKIETVLDDLNIAPDQVTVIIDNQPRNKEVCKIVNKTIDNGYSVVIWNIDDSKGKDINAMIQGGMTPREVFSTIKRCTTRGLEAKMKFIQWKKVDIGRR